MSTPDAIENYRRQFHRHPELTHLNNAGTSPLPECTRAVVEHWSRRSAEEGFFAAYDLWNESNAVRTRLARFLGAKDSEVAFFGCTAEALSQIAFGIDLKPGDEIITWKQEYPSNFYPWRDAVHRTGARLVALESGPAHSAPIERIMEAVTPRTRVIATSWVQYQTGAIVDLQTLAAFARSKGIRTVVDGIQGLGVLPFDFHESGIDAIAGGSHKWLTSPLSTGFLCVREDWIEEIRPLMVGAITYGTPEMLNNLQARRSPTAAAFEPGSKNFTDIAALGRTLELIEVTGIARIAQEAEWLARRLLHGLRERGYTVHSPHGAHHRGAIVTFSEGSHSARRSVEEIVTCLQENKISFAKRELGVRLSPHAFNTLADIEKVLGVL